MKRIAVLKIYLWLVGTFTLVWWPLSHWFYPDWYHRLLGFERYDYSLVKIIGTIGIIPVLGIYFTALNPLRNRDIVITLLVFFVLMAATYIYLISAHNFPVLEYINVCLLLVNTIILGALYPWRSSANKNLKPTPQNGSPDI